MIEILTISLLFLIPGFIILELSPTDAKGKYLLTPYLSFGYFNFLSIVLFLFDISGINYWFYVLSLVPLLFIFKLRLNLDMIKNFTFIFILFRFFDTILNFFTLISLPGNTNNTFDEVYRLYNFGSEQLNIGLIPLPMFTSGLFTNLDFSVTIINIFFLQFIFISIFTILNISKNIQHVIVTVLFLITNLAIFEVFYELVSYRSHSLTASSFMVLFVYFHKDFNLNSQKVIIFFAIFLLFNSRLENILFGYLYLFSLVLLNRKKFIVYKKISIFASVLAGLYMVLIPRTNPQEDLRSSNIFILLVVLVGLILINYEFINPKLFVYSSVLFTFIYLVVMYIVSSDIFLSVTALTFTKVLDPNSGYGLQFLFFMIIYIYVCSQSTTISHLFSSYMLFILSINFLIGFLQTFIYQGQASIEYIENLSIFNPLDLSTFRGSVQTLSVLWAIAATAFNEDKYTKKSKD